MCTARVFHSLQSLVSLGYAMHAGLYIKLGDSSWAVRLAQSVVHSCLPDLVTALNICLSTAEAPRSNIRQTKGIMAERPMIY
ncbi:hypothetical protein D6D19_02888 [Aureobasidium pullulans]|uniref:Uncharacterized protein n=1 Tax=Aureobasidium pullulans TaxID=5580 RepID=A0A4S9ABL3_AURPU|nr:hypothetical protein D6D19_02888 [Aureobasidium pullulans]THX48343.1 hypothetical protein D6D08_10071 [Aureobasidium pullulans]THY29495.1 hypothetical protein D6D00_03568 [Aureobasidium pullulans]THY56352.1 hypothetical protein D6C97_05146 [Aureobasidium pullulans]TIA06764.1 hypothetical protein D6C81_09765 [Aureobasidium pullulans]